MFTIFYVSGISSSEAFFWKVMAKEYLLYPIENSAYSLILIFFCFCNCLVFIEKGLETHNQELLYSENISILKILSVSKELHVYSLQSSIGTILGTDFSKSEWLTSLTHKFRMWETDSQGSSSSRWLVSLFWCLFGVFFLDFWFLPNTFIFRLFTDSFLVCHFQFMLT